MNIRFDCKQLMKALENAEVKQKTALMMYAQTSAQKMENYAKSHRRWVDRTGNAKQSLVGFVERCSNSVRIYISHGVDYGKWLEVRFNKRYAILMPTVQATSGEIVKGFSRLLDKIL